MKHLREKMIYILMTALFCLCFVSAVIAIRVTVTVIEKSQQIIRSDSQNIVDEDFEQVSNNIEAVKLSDFTFNLNGDKENKVAVYLDTDRGAMVSIDSLLDLIGVNYSYFSSDDIFTAEISQKELVFKLGEKLFAYGGIEYKLKAVPLAAKGHILVPLEMLKQIPGFDSEISFLKNTVFAYYDPIQEARAYPDVCLLTVNKDGIPGLYDITGKKIVDSRNKILDVSTEFYGNVSDDGRYLFSCNLKEKTINIFDIENFEFKTTGNFSDELADTGNNFYVDGFNILFDYKEDSDYIRIVLTNEKYSRYYTYVEYKGEKLLSGEVKVSPDRKCLLYNEDNAFKVLKSALNSVEIGSASYAEWISNDLISLEMDNGYYIIDINGVNNGTVENQYRLLGKSLFKPSDEVFYKADTLVYHESGGITTKLPYTYSGAEYITGLSHTGPFIETSPNANAVIYRKENYQIMISTHKQLITSNKTGDLIAAYEDCIGLSPDKRYYSILVRDNGLLGLILIDNSTAAVRKLAINQNTNDLNVINNIKIKWLSHDEIIVYSHTGAYLISVGENNIITRVKLPERTLLKGVF